MRSKEDNGSDFELSKGTAVISMYTKGGLKITYIFGDSPEANPAADYCTDRPSSILPSRPEDDAFLDMITSDRHRNPDLVEC
jgi:hypothetical protein